MLRLVLPWVTPAREALEAARLGPGEDRLLATCRCLLAAARVHRAAGFEAAGPALGLAPGSDGSGGVLALLSELTRAVLAAASGGPGGGPDWGEEASELLLEAWVELVADPCRGPLSSSQAAAAAAAAVFAAVTSQALQQAALEVLEDEGWWRNIVFWAWLGACWALEGGLCVA